MKYLLTNIWQNECGQVSAGTPRSFDSEEEAIEQAKRQLADDFGITLEEVEELAQEGGTPYVLALSKDGSLDAFTICSLPEESVLEVKTPEGQLFAMADSKNGRPGISIFREFVDKMVTVEFDEKHDVWAVKGYMWMMDREGDKPHVAYDYIDGTDLTEEKSYTDFTKGRVDPDRVSEKFKKRAGSAKWSYEIRDIETRKLLMSVGSFDSESDAREQARMEASLHNIKGYSIFTRRSSREKEKDTISYCEPDLNCSD